MQQKVKLSISIVSHYQGALVADLLSDLGTHCAIPIEVILTINAPEVLPFDATAFSFPVTVLKNEIPKGFGANHNAAFQLATAEYFCVLNPDIRLENDPFPLLLDALSDTENGVVGPLIISPAGNIEDSARRFPTPLLILKRVLLGVRAIDYEITSDTVYPDWIAGMFMLFRSQSFRQIDGFDEKYFLYYEDVDLCLNLRRAGYRAALIPKAVAIHDARRESHRNIKYLLWHMQSLLRFLARF